MALKVELKEVEGSVDLKGNSTATEELEAKVAQWRRWWRRWTLSWR